MAINTHLSIYTLNVNGLNAPIKRQSGRLDLKKKKGVPVVAQWLTIQLGTMRLWVQSLALLSRLRIQCCHELWCRSQTWLGSQLLWLWCRPVAAALARPLAWEPPYATGAALEMAKRQKKKKSLQQVAYKRLTLQARTHIN